MWIINFGMFILHLDPEIVNPRVPGSSPGRGVNSSKELRSATDIQQSLISKLLVMLNRLLAYWLKKYCLNLYPQKKADGRHH